MTGQRLRRGSLAFLCFALAGAAPGARGAATADLFELSIEELSRIQVISPGRRAETVRTTASAVHVITRDEIRRSGYTRLPEILRLAPGVEVARNGAHGWTISMRGFNHDLSNKLLVLIDGRSVYSPLFGGVFWDAQDTLAQDIERIEVVGGPGGTLWGSNAVNGVINVITRSARDTQGVLVEVGAGDERPGFGSVRVGWRPAADAHARAYLKYYEGDPSAAPAGGDAADAWRTVQAGFRADFERGPAERLTVQGDVYDGELHALLRPDFTLGTPPGPDRPGTVDTGGFNLLGSWDRDIAGGGHVQLRSWLDHTSREIPGTYAERRNTFDLDFQHDLARRGRHQLIWGAGFRITRDDLENTLFATFVPEERTDRIYSLFAQDDIHFRDDTVTLTLGAKIEHNGYTDVEVQPNVRLSWLLDDRHMLWGAVSRAERIPARLDTDLELTAPVAIPDLPVPLYVAVSGSDGFEAEELIAAKLGYRFGLGTNASLDLSVFQHDYDELQTQEQGELFAVGDPAQYLVLPATLANGMKGRSRGGTAVIRWQAHPAWRLQLHYSHLDLDLRLKPGSNAVASTDLAGNSPKHQAALHSWVELPGNFDLYTGVYHVGELSSLGVPERTLVDLTLGWQITEALRTSLTVRNLNDEAHLEFGGGNLFERHAYLRAIWSF